MSNFIKRKHPRMGIGEKKNQRARTKVQAGEERAPKRGAGKERAPKRGATRR
jgi:hypothetical protein